MNSRISPLVASAPLVGALLAGFLLAACSSPIPNRDPIGERFPTAAGKSLEGDPVALPDDLAGAPAVLLLGYVQDAQFDADRWLYGLLDAQLPVRVLEVPTMRGLFPRALAGTIDSGMRSGIPAEDWQTVVTVYGGEAADIVALTGNETPRNIRVVLLDGEGRVRWFHDSGYSPRELLELEQALAALE